MEDYMLLEYLRNQGMGHNMTADELMYKFKEFMRGKNMRYESPEYNESNMRYNSMYFDNPSRDYGMKYPLNVNFNRYQGMPSSYRNHKSGEEYGTHFSEYEARAIVDKMYHYYNGKRVSGEIFTMEKAKEVYNANKQNMYGDVDYTEVYVAINAQYHDYCPLYKQWFGNNADHKIIESAILFWFKDEDYNKGSKIINYFS